MSSEQGVPSLPSALGPGDDVAGPAAGRVAYLAFLDLSLLICKMGATCLPASGDGCKGDRERAPHAWPRAGGPSVGRLLTVTERTRVWTHARWPVMFRWLRVPGEAPRHRLSFPLVSPFRSRKLIAA